MTRDLIETEPDTELGPKMRALSHLQREFVIALFEHGDNNATRAARVAGYTDNPNALKVTAHRMLHSPKIRAAMHEEAERRMDGGKLMALNWLLSIASNPQHKDQFKAVTAILDRSGLHATTEHKVTVRDQSKTDEAMVDRIKQLAIKQGYSDGETQKLLASAGYIDAEFTVVNEIEDWENA